MAKDKANKPKKQRWYRTMIEAYKITKRSYPQIGWMMLGAATIGLAVGIVLWLTTHHLVWLFLGIMLGALLPMYLLVRYVRKASYAQIEGMPGAVSAVLDNIGRGWDVKNEPVRFNSRTQDLLFRAIGRPGVVLITEGPKSRVQQLVDTERRELRRVAPNAPVHVINVGNDEGQTPLIKLDRVMSKLPKRISNEEVAALANRLEALSNKSLPIPKGIDPTKTRMSRRALRGN